jgi:hypothetical protein
VYGALRVYKANKAQQDLRVQQVHKVLKVILALRGLKD